MIGLLVESAHSMLKDIKIADIMVGSRHRRDACRDVPEGQRDYLWVPPAPRYHVGSHE